MKIEKTVETERRILRIYSYREIYIVCMVCSIREKKQKEKGEKKFLLSYYSKKFRIGIEALMQLDNIESFLDEIGMHPQLSL